VVAEQVGNDHPTFTPSGVYPTSDGYINISAAGPRLWSRLCKALERPEWMDRPGWETTAARTRDRAAVNAAVTEVTRQKSSAHWSQALEDNGVPAGPIYRINEAFGDPQVRHLGMARKVVHPRLGEFEVVASPLNFEGRSKDVRSATREAGADTADVLGEIGYSAADIEALRQKGVI
jgi:crotonobetainyl-CoA:carnitine CoA-transferase CaiB-like acyl-CoA transferase